MISVLIPIYNTSIDYIKQSVDSVLNQTFKKFEIIIANDGSNNETSSYLDTLGNNPVIKILHLEHRGISQTLNSGLKECQYNIIARMDGDDIMINNRLEKQYEFITTNNVDILGSQMKFFGTQHDGMITTHPADLTKEMIVKKDWFMNHPTIMYLRDKILSINGYNTEYNGCEDYELWCRSLWNNFTLHNLNDILVLHRRHGKNSNNPNIPYKIKQIQNYYKSLVL